MFRLLRRLLLWGLLFVAAIWIVSRLLNREEDFDDYDDIDIGMDFVETPVEIDVPAESAPSQGSSTQSAAHTTPLATIEPAPTSGTGTETQAANANGQGRSLVDINGIGPTYAARLQEVGISSLADLAKANPEALAEKIEVIGGHTQIEDWIKQAQEMTSGGASGGE
jgi:predicted flap endonuclease-1-like 5' DNA nuclease